MQRRQVRRWEGNGSRINVTNHGVMETRRDFEVEMIRPPEDLYSTRNSFDTGSQPNDVELEASFPRQDDTTHTLHAIETKGDTAQVASSGEKQSVIESLTTPISETDVAPRLECTAESSEFCNQEDLIKASFVEGVKQVKDEQTVKPWRNSETHSKQPEETIYNLIVSVKAPQTVKAIQTVAHRLTQESTITFLQNGMGIIDEVNEELFPDEDKRPTYIIGVVSHGLYSSGSFSVIRSGEGTIALGAMPRMPPPKSTEAQRLSELATSARYLIRTMTRTPVFVAVGFPATDLLQQQLDKLVVNCIINPITAVIDCQNGALLSNMYFTRVMRLLLAEISIVIKSLPELKNVPNVKMRFDTLRLERIVCTIAHKTAENHSSMLQDVRLGKPTEIDYINGYVIRRGEELGIHCVMNYMLMHMVKAKNKIKNYEQAELLPLVGRRREK